MIRYRSVRPLETELRDLANERRRFGYRRLFVLLRREGELSGINRIYRLYREEGLAVRKRRARRKYRPSQRIDAAFAGPVEKPAGDRLTLATSAYTPANWRSGPPKSPNMTVTRLRRAHTR